MTSTFGIPCDSEVSDLLGSSTTAVTVGQVNTESGNLGRDARAHVEFGPNCAIHGYSSAIVANQGSSVGSHSLTVTGSTTGINTRGGVNLNLYKLCLQGSTSTGVSVTHGTNVDLTLALISGTASTGVAIQYNCTATLHAIYCGRAVVNVTYLSAADFGTSAIINGAKTAALYVAFDSKITAQSFTCIGCNSSYAFNIVDNSSVWVNIGTFTK